MPSAISRIAQLSDVIWVERVERKVRFDEVQDLILAGQTNGLGNGPSTTMGITNYLDFLVNSVGGGLTSFFDPFTYAIVDVADTGIDVINPNTGNIVQPSLLGHVAYASPASGDISLVLRQIRDARHSTTTSLVRRTSTTTEHGSHRLLPDLTLRRTILISLLSFRQS